MAPHDSDPNKIDVSLNIMSDATLTAINNLTNQLASLREFVASQGVSDPGSKSESMSRAASFVQQSYVAGAVPNRPTGPVQGGPTNNPSEGAQSSAERSKKLRAEYTAYMEDVERRSGWTGPTSRHEDPQMGPPKPLSPDAAAAMSRNLSDVQRYRLAGQEKRLMGGSRMDRFFSMYPGVTRDPNEDTSYGFESGTGRGDSAIPSGMGYPARGPTTTDPMAKMGDMPGWAQTLSRDGISPESRFGLTIPRLGEFTIQDKLNMAAQWMGRSAMRREDAGDTGKFTTGLGRVAAGSAYLRDQSAAFTAINREFQRVRGFAAGQELGGESLGYSRDTGVNPSLFGIGFRLNIPGMSEASREGLHEEWTQRRVQAAAGVSGEEAQRIRQVVAGMGYSGDTNANLQYNLFKPLQQRGIGPETFAPIIDQGIRQGNSSINTLKDTMIDLADAARNANMTLDEVASSTLQYSESVQALGANYEKSLQNAATFTRSGLDPRIAAQSMQSPMMQGILQARTGITPDMQGILGAGTIMQGMTQAAQVGLAMGAPYRNLPDVVTRSSVTGQVIDRTTGADAQLAMASQVSGIPRQVLERMQKNPNFLQIGGEAQQEVTAMQNQLRAMTHRSRTRVVGESHGRLGSLDLLHQLGGPRTEVESYTKNLTNAQRAALEHGSNADSVVQYDELEQQMIAMDPHNADWTKRVRKIRKDHGDIEDRLGVAQRIIGEATKATAAPDYLVGLTPEARKILKIEKPKERDSALPRANAGGVPANGGMLGPGFPSSVGGAMSYGSPGGP